MNSGTSKVILAVLLAFLTVGEMFIMSRPADAAVVNAGAGVNAGVGIAAQRTIVARPGLNGVTGVPGPGLNGVVANPRPGIVSFPGRPGVVVMPAPVPAGPPVR